MLVLSRKLGESLVIGEGSEAIVVTVVRLEPGRVRLGVEAKRETKIIRGEFLDEGTTDEQPRNEL